MSAIPTPAASLAEPRRLTLPAGLVTTWRTMLLLGLVLLVPGEADRIGSTLHPRP